MKELNTEKFKKLLQAKKETTLEELKDFAAQDPHSKNNWKSKFPSFEQEGFDIEEASDEVEEYINRLPVEKVLEKKLVDINTALDKIKNKTYGKCTKCNKDIPLKRLEVLPEATVCLDCKK